MNFNKSHVSRNLVDIRDFTATTTPASQDGILWTGTLAEGTYTFSINQDDTLTSSTRNTIHIKIGSVNYHESTSTNYHNNSGRHSYTFTVPDATTTVTIYYWTHTISNDCSFSQGMLNEGSTALPYEPYSSEVWHDIPHYVHNTSTDTITTLPAVIYPNDTTATVGLKGNMQQTGTPSPQNSVMPEGCGDEDGIDGFIVTTTVNGATTKEAIANEGTYNITAPQLSGSIFNYWEDDTGIISYNDRLSAVVDRNVHYTAVYGQSMPNKSNCYRLEAFKTIDNAQDTIACTFTHHILSEIEVTEVGLIHATNKLLGYDSSYGQDYAKVNLMELPDWDVYELIKTNGKPHPSGYTSVNGRYVYNLRIGTAHQNYIYFIGYYKYTEDGEEKIGYSDTVVAACYDTSLNKSTPITHYKIPISSANTTTPIYLGEVQSTRRIKKLVLTGEESWTYEEAYSRFWINVADFTTLGLRLTPFISNAFGSISDGRPIADVPNNTIYSGTWGGVDTHKIFIKCTAYTSVADFKSYLATQYAAGTPVSIWYVLKNEETGIVNEPLMKIGDYADEVANISIPVTAEANTLSVDTTVQPSEVTVNYKGWHPVQSVHEKSKNVLPSPVAATKSNNGITVRSDGVGRYYVSGTAENDAYITFNIPPFLIPKSVAHDGNGTFSMFNTKTYVNSAVKLEFYYQGTFIDNWGLINLNRTSINYTAMANRTIDTVGIFVISGSTVDFQISPEFTNDGVLPTNYEPYWT